MGNIEYNYSHPPWIIWYLPAIGVVVVMEAGLLLPAPFMAVMEMVYLASSSTPDRVYCLVVPSLSGIILVPSSPGHPLMEKL